MASGLRPLFSLLGTPPTPRVESRALRWIVAFTVACVVTMAALYLLGRVVPPIATRWMVEGRVLSVLDQLVMASAHLVSRWWVFLIEGLVGALLYGWVVFFRMRREKDV